MKQELKIKIKEVVEERRKLTADEEFIYNLECGIGMGYLGEKGLMPLSRIADQSYVFLKETIRDATPEEEEAWYEIQGLAAFHKISKEEISKHHRYYFVDNHERYNELLKNKEIILELVEVNE